MKTIQYSTQDKSTWGDGPWQNEPDKMQYQDEATGLPVLIVRNKVGSLCGYVGVSAKHPLYEKSYDDCEGEIDVHGGLTFADHCQSMGRQAWQKWRESMLKRKQEAEQFPKGDMAIAWVEEGDLVEDYEAWAKHCEETSICHTVEDGEDDQVWWFGFDTAHAGDFNPKLEAQMKGIIPDHRPFEGDSYKTLAYVQAECRSLAKQLKELEHGD